MTTIVFATGNAHKMTEIRQILKGLNARILSRKEAGIQADIEETGTTFEENALAKARAVAAKLKEQETDPAYRDAIVLADDSGLEIDHLNKEPGIYSARYMGKETPYTVKNQNLISRLEGVPDEERTARFVCAAAAVFPDGTTRVVRGTMEGRIAHAPAGENGFGYDPIFYLPSYGCTSAQLSPEEKNAVSHRGQALREMCQVLADTGGVKTNADFDRQ